MYVFSVIEINRISAYDVVTSLTENNTSRWFVQVVDVDDKENITDVLPPPCSTGSFDDYDDDDRSE